MDDSMAEHERAQLLRWSQLTYAQRLEWLWQAKLFAQRAVAAARARSHQPSAYGAGAIERDGG